MFNLFVNVVVGYSNGWRKGLTAAIILMLWPSVILAVFKCRKFVLDRRQSELRAKSLADYLNNGAVGTTTVFSSANVDGNSIVRNPVVGEDDRGDSMGNGMASHNSASFRNTGTSHMSTRTTFQNFISRRTAFSRSSVGILSDSIVIRAVEEDKRAFGHEENRVQCIEESYSLTFDGSRSFNRSAGPSAANMDNL